MMPSAKRGVFNVLLILAACTPTSSVSSGSGDPLGPDLPPSATTTTESGNSGQPPDLPQRSDLSDRRDLSSPAPDLPEEGGAEHLDLEPLLLPIGDPLGNEGYVTHFNIDYTEGGIFGTPPSADRILNMWIPDAAGPHPVLFFVHGGGWISGGPAPSPLLPLATIKDGIGAGIAIVSVGYTLGESSADAESFPQNVRDVFCGLRYVKKYGDSFDLDVSRIAGLGESAGGHLLAVMAYADPLGPTLDAACG